MRKEKRRCPLLRLARREGSKFVSSFLIIYHLWQDRAEGISPPRRGFSTTESGDVQIQGSEMGQPRSHGVADRDARCLSAWIVASKVASLRRTDYNEERLMHIPGSQGSSIWQTTTNILAWHALHLQVVIRRVTCFCYIEILVI